MIPINAARHAVAICSLALLAACGGGNVETTSSQPSIAGDAPTAQAANADDRKTASAVAASSALEAPYTSAEALILFDWAQYSYPSLFLNSQSLVTLDYLGTSYLVRSYPNGNNLGLTLDGRIFGLGPFTANELIGFGKYSDYYSTVAQDYCNFRRSSCTVPVVTSAPNAITVLADQSATFSVIATGSLALNYQWRRNGQDIPGATSPTYRLSNSKPDDSGAKFSVAVKNEIGSTVSTEAVLTVAALPRQVAGRRWQEGQKLEIIGEVKTVGMAADVGIDQYGNLLAIFVSPNTGRWVSRRGILGQSGPPVWSTPAEIGQGGIRPDGKPSFKVYPNGSAIVAWYVRSNRTACPENIVFSNGCFDAYLSRYDVNANEWSAPVAINAYAAESLTRVAGERGFSHVNDRGDVMICRTCSGIGGVEKLLVLPAVSSEVKEYSVSIPVTSQTGHTTSYGFGIDNSGGMFMAVSSRNSTQGESGTVLHRGTVSTGFTSRTVLQASSSDSIERVITVGDQQVLVWRRDYFSKNSQIMVTLTSSQQPALSTYASPVGLDGEGRLNIVPTDTGELLFLGLDKKRRATWSPASGWSSMIAMPATFPERILSDFKAKQEFYPNSKGDVLIVEWTIGTGGDSGSGSTLLYDGQLNAMVSSATPSDPSGMNYLFGFDSTGIAKLPHANFKFSSSGVAVAYFVSDFSALPSKAVLNPPRVDASNLWTIVLR